MIRIIVFLLSLWGGGSSTYAQTHCITEKDTKACLLDDTDERKKIALYKNDVLIGTWNKMIATTDNTEISIDESVVNVVNFSPPFIRGFSINIRSQDTPFVDRIFEEFRVSPLDNNMVSSIVLTAHVDVTKGSRTDFDPSTVSLSLYSVGKEVLITSDKAFLRSQLTETAQRQPYVIRGDRVKLLSYHNQQFYVSYQANSKLYKGWIYLSDVLGF